MKAANDAIFIGMPHTGQAHVRAIEALHMAVRGRPLMLAEVGGSNLARNFDLLLCAALNARREDESLRWFGMLHSDVAAPAGWADTLIEEAEHVKADVLSCVIAIREGGQRTSTAMSVPDRFSQQLGLKTGALKMLPPTFSVEDCRAAGLCNGEAVLLVNTGCWVARLDRPWWTEADQDGAAAVNFEIDTRRRLNADGMWVAETDSEDWRMSRLLAERGARVYATTILPVTHLGGGSWTVGGPKEESRA